MTHARPAPTTALIEAARPDDQARMLRLVVRVDGVSTAVMAAILIVAAGPLGDLTGMPAAFTYGFGAYQLAGAAVLLLIARLPVIRPVIARTVITVNLLSGVGCVALAFADPLSLTDFGFVFLLVGAVVVTVYAALEQVGLRRLTHAA
ncbi:hypothetical protein ACH41E_06225 [Streptomyces sp. NPDC020412]|uniref:hypothetical protein n=1 Tax=Streptomyces sp. NPDC020412 TaxID=3365073 RepID=UPI00378FB423